MSSSPSNTRRLAWATFAALALFDVAAYFDCALRWHHGFEFLHQKPWLAWALPGAGAWLCVVGWLVRERAGFIRHFGLTFAAFSWGFVAASIGNPIRDWHQYPFSWSLLDDGTFSAYFMKGDSGFNVALIACMSHGILGRSSAKHTRQPVPSSLERWLGAVGVAYLGLAACLSTVLLDGVLRREPTPMVLPLREALSTGALCIGAGLVTVSALLLGRRALKRLRSRNA